MFSEHKVLSMHTLSFKNEEIWLKFLGHVFLNSAKYIKSLEVYFYKILNKRKINAFKRFVLSICYQEQEQHSNYMRSMEYIDDSQFIKIIIVWKGVANITGYNKLISGRDMNNFKTNFKV